MSQRIVEFRSAFLILLVVLAFPGFATAAITAHFTTRGAIFDPLEVTINAGDTVEWDQNDNQEHTVTSLDDVFDAGFLEPGDTFTFTFNTPGSYGFYCRIHGYGMSGVVNVVEAAPNNPPAMPVNQTPANNATNLPLTVNLGASTFSDSDGDTHAASQWIVHYASNNVVAVDSGEVSSSLTNDAPAGLAAGTSYDWQVRYKDSRGAWSDYSAATRFSTLAIASGPPALLSAGGFTNGNLRISGVGGASSHFSMLATTNFIQWTNIGTATSDVSGNFLFLDSNAMNFKARFYRTTN